MNSDNPHVFPGQYDPQRQAKTEVGDYLSAIYPGYFDPTQVAMRPGDTQIPMQIETSPAPPQQENTERERLELIQQEYRQKIDLQYQQQKLQSRNEINITPAISNQIQSIKIPIVIELTINLNIKHNEC